MPCHTFRMDRNDTVAGSCAIMPRHMLRMRTLDSSSTVSARIQPSNVMASYSCQLAFGLPPLFPTTSSV